MAAKKKATQRRSRPTPAKRAEPPAASSLVEPLQNVLPAAKEDLRSTVEELESSNEERKASRYLATVLMNSSDAIIVHDFDGHITVWNRGAERLYGYSQAEAQQMNIVQIIAAELQPQYHGILARLRRGERIESFETRRIAKNGRAVDVWVTSMALLDDAGLPAAVAKTDRDITERNRAQANLQREVNQRTAALQESESRLRAILNAPHDAIVTFDSKGIIDSVNPAAERLFGYPAGKMTGLNMRVLVPVLYRDKAGSDQKPAAENMSREVLAYRQDGSTFHVDFAMSEVEQLKLFTAVLRDITRRKELEREVVAIAALEQERIGQDLHDQCGQELTALGLFADALANSLQQRSPADVVLARKITQRAKAVLRQVRNIAKGLALAAVEPANLPDALDELASRLSETSGVRCVFHDGHAGQPDDGIQATHLYHIAQEACTNALKHADAKNIEIRLTSQDDTLILTIRDDGRGVPTDVEEGLGLRIMRNRANVIGAALVIAATKPQGTTVTCTLTREESHDRLQN